MSPVSTSVNNHPKPIPTCFSPWASHFPRFQFPLLQNEQGISNATVSLGVIYLSLDLLYQQTWDAPLEMVYLLDHGSCRWLFGFWGLGMLPVQVHQAHLRVVEMADLAQVLACHHTQPGSKSLAEQTQHCGPEQHPEQL